MIIYNGPIEEPIENPSDELIKDIIYNKDETYWKQGSGDSCFEIGTCNERLIFFYDEPYGFFILRHPDYLVPLNEMIEPLIIEHLVGGEPMKVPICCYVNRETAYNIITHFIHNKEISNLVKWVDLYEIINFE